ncbi:MAG: hypothetical protein WCG25_09180 [bacterium]
MLFSWFCFTTLFKISFIFICSQFFSISFIFTDIISHIEIDLNRSKSASFLCKIPFTLFPISNVVNNIFHLTLLTTQSWVSHSFISSIEISDRRANLSFNHIFLVSVFFCFSASFSCSIFAFPFSILCLYSIISFFKLIFDHNTFVSVNSLVGKY